VIKVNDNNNVKQQTMKLFNDFLKDYMVEDKYHDYLFEDICKFFAHFQDKMSEDDYNLLLNDIRFYVIFNEKTNG